MKILNSIKAILIILSISLSSIAFSAEPQMMLYTKPSQKKGRKIASITKSENLKSFEINNGEMIQLFAFKSEKKAMNNLTVEVFAETKVKKDALSL